MCVDLFFKLSSETFVLLRRNWRNIVTTLHRSSSKVLIILVTF
jgi:hypothetical protein